MESESQATADFESAPELFRITDPEQRGAINLGSIGLSEGTGRILKRMHANGNISYHEMHILDGGISIGQTYETKKGKRLLLPKR